MRTRIKGLGWRAAVLLAVLALVAAACGDDDEAVPAATTAAPGATTQPEVATTQPEVATTQPEVATTQPEVATTQPISEIVIGEVYSATGAFAPFSLPAHTGLAMAIEQVNEQGFVVGDTTYRLRHVFKDDRSEQTDAVAAATELTRDEGATVIFGPIGPPAVAVAQLTQPSNIVQLTPASAVARSVGTEGNRELFLVLPSFETRIDAALGAITEFAPTARNIAFFGQDDATGQGLFEGMSDGMTDLGLTATSYIYPTDTTDLSPILTRLASDDPDLVLFGWSSVQDNENIYNQLPGSGLGTDVVMFGWSIQSVDCANLGGRPCIASQLNFYDLSETAPQAAQQFAEDYLEFTEQLSLSPAETSLAPMYYDALFMVIAAIQEAGTDSDGAQIAETLRGLQYDGLMGPVQFDETNSFKGKLRITFVADGEERTETFG